MPRIRTIKPEFPQSESIGRLSRDARLLFIQLWTIADDAGRTRAASRMLASLLYPYDTDAPKLIDRWLTELVTEGMVTLYEIDGAKYLEITKWLDHQKIDRPSPSRLPAPIEGSRTIARAREGSSTDLGPVPRTSTKDQDQGPSGDGLENEFAEWWAVYPRRDAKAPARKAYANARNKTDHATLMAGAKRFAANPPSDPKFIPLPASWLNAERWADEGAAGRPTASGTAPAGTSANGKTEADWSRILARYKPGGFWSPNWGNRPEEGNRDIPPHVYAEWRDGQIGSAA